MKPFEVEVRKIKIFCKTLNCKNLGSTSQKSAHRNVRDFSKSSKEQAVHSFKTGVQINAPYGSQPTQGKWKRTTKGWLCPECQ